ncbi:hypothetical protein ACLOJK_011005 [Asimina triloba]
MLNIYKIELRIEILKIIANDKRIRMSETPVLLRVTYYSVNRNKYMHVQCLAEISIDTFALKLGRRENEYLHLVFWSGSRQIEDEKDRVAHFKSSSSATWTTEIRNIR